MKRCPTCDKTFDDNMRFCQSDGTPLVDDAPVDPYKTMVARPEDIAAMIPPVVVETPVSEPPVKEEEEVLQIPEASDPLKTMYASEEEIRNAMASKDADEQVIEIPPLVEPEPPKFIEPSLSPPPSPFSQPESSSPAEAPFSKTTPPIPSPFTDPKAATYRPPAAFEPSAPEPPKIAEPEPAFNPFNQPTPEVKAPMVQAEWTAPPAPSSNVQEQNAQFQPGSAQNSAGQNKTLPIVSIVAGVLSLCCWLSPITGIVAVVTGFLGMKNANNDPANYGGKGLAVAGMIIGGVFFIIGIAYWIFIIFFNGLALLMQATQ